jgi:hypothetical protein
MASSPALDSEKKVIDDSQSEDAVLAQLGYTAGTFGLPLCEGWIAHITQNSSAALGCSEWSDSPSAL